MASESTSTRRGKQGASQVRTTRGPTGTSEREGSRQSGGAGNEGAVKSSKQQPLLVSGIGLTSVFRISLVFYFLIFLIVLAAMVILWQVFGSSGYELKANHLIDSLLGSTSYHIIGSQVLVVFVGLGIVWVVLASVVTMIGTRIFNAVATLIGGITIYVRTGGPTRGKSV